MPHLIRLTPTNADTFFDFWLTTYQDKKVNGFFFKPHYFPREAMRALYDRFIANPDVHFFIYADEQNKPLGTARVTHFSGERDHAVMLNAVAIDPTLQGGGHGQKMMTMLKNFVTTHYPQVTRIELCYEGDNPVGRHFYEKRLGYVQQAVVCNDWWIRKGTAQNTDELLAIYPWYCDERFCTLTLTDDPAIPSTIDERSKRLPTALAKLPNTYSIAQTQQPLPMADIVKLIGSYNAVEQLAMQQINAQPHQTIFTLKHQEQVVAMVVIRPYHGEIRLRHAVTLPCVAFSNDVDSKVLSAFLLEAMTTYRQSNPEVCHFAACEPDTNETWYANLHSKMPMLSRVLHDADLQYIGEVTNYFNKSAASGRNLLCFERVCLDLNSAKECIAVSTLNDTEKFRLNALVRQLREFSDLTPRDQYEIYRLIRFVAYPQDYTVNERKTQMRNSVELLKTSENFDRSHEVLDRLYAILQKQLDASSPNILMRSPRAQRIDHSDAAPQQKLAHNIN